MVEVLAVIPARGGSKGIPRKNMRSVGGAALICHTIQTALLAESINRVIVSTDSQEIAIASYVYGVEVIFRPPELCTDTSPSEHALLHVLDTLDSRNGTKGVHKPEYHLDILVMLQCTSPLTLPEDIDGAVGKLIAEDADSALTVIPSHALLWEEGLWGAVPVNHSTATRLNRQEMDETDPQYRETGAVTVMRVKGFRESEYRYFGKTVLYVIPEERGLDIDTEFDLKVAELLTGQVQD